MWQASQEICGAAAAAEEAAHRDQHHSGTGLPAVRDKARAVLDAFRVLAKLAMRTSAAVQAAAASLQRASHAPPPQVSAALCKTYTLGITWFHHMLSGQFVLSCLMHVTACIAAVLRLMLFPAAVICAFSSAQHRKPGSQVSSECASGHHSRGRALLHSAVCFSNCQQMKSRIANLKTDSLEALSLLLCRGM